MHGSKLKLSVWFWAAYPTCLRRSDLPTPAEAGFAKAGAPASRRQVATHSNGISALQLMKQLGLGSYKTAWLLTHELRRAMVAPDRTPLMGLVEVDKTAIPFRTKNDRPAGGGGRSHQGKLFVAGAVEVRDGKPGRLRLAAIEDFSANILHRFLDPGLAAGSRA